MSNLVDPFVYVCWLVSVSLGCLALLLCTAVDVYCYIHYSCLFGTFIGNCEKQREKLVCCTFWSRLTVLCCFLLQKVRVKTISLWSFINNQVKSWIFICSCVLMCTPEVTLLCRLNAGLFVYKGHCTISILRIHAKKLNTIRVKIEQLVLACQKVLHSF